MKGWSARRGSVFSTGFDQYLATLGHDHHWLWDHAIADIEKVLCSASREHLDTVYPPDVNGLRLMLTAKTRGLPPLRLAFYIDDQDYEKIVYVAVARRE